MPSARGADDEKARLVPPAAGDGLIIGAYLQRRAEKWSSLSTRSIATKGYKLCKAVDDDVEPLEVAVWHLRDAKLGRSAVPHIHSSWEFLALRLCLHPYSVRFIQVLCALLVALPFLEGPHFFMDPAEHSLWSQGHITVLGSSFLEVVIASILTVELSLLYSLRDRCDENDGRTKVLVRNKLSVFLVSALWLDLAIFFSFEAVTGLTWYRWSRLCAPFLYISSSIHLRAFVTGAMRAMPNMLPILTVLFGLLVFFAFAGFLLFSPLSVTDCRRVKHGKLDDLTLFDFPRSALETMAHVFVTPSSALGIEEEYHSCTGIHVFFLTYAIVMVLLLGTLVVAAANKAFTAASREAYEASRNNRARALHLAYSLLMQEGGVEGGGDSFVPFDVWERLVQKMRPALLPHAKALYDSPPIGSIPQKTSRGKATFFALACILFSEADEESRSDWALLDGLKVLARTVSRWFLRIPFTKIHFRVVWLAFHTAVLCNAALQLHVAMEGTSLRAKRTELALLVFFCIDSVIYMLGWGLVSVLRNRRHRWNLILNVAAGLHFAGLWFSGPGPASLYLFLQSTRVLLTLRAIMIIVRPGVEKRFSLTLMAAFRAVVVILAWVYLFAILAFGCLGSSPVGRQPLAPIESDPAVQPYLAYVDVLGFSTFNKSFLTLNDVMIFAIGWPLVVDVAAVAWGSATVTFIYIGSVIIFYCFKPVMVGYVVQSYMQSCIKMSETDRKAHFYKQDDPGLREMQDVFVDRPDGEVCALSSTLVDEDDPERTLVAFRQASQGPWQFQEEENDSTNELRQKLHVSEKELKKLRSLLGISHQQ